MAIENTKIIISAEDRTKQAFNSVKNNLTSISTLLGAAGVGFFATAIKSAADFSDEIGEASERLGISTVALSELKYAAQLTGGSFEVLQSGIRNLSKSIFSAAEGSKQDVETFAQLGVDIRDASGNLKTADQVILDLADSFQKLPDGASKSALAMRLFGKAGTDLVPLLSQGSSGIRDFAEEARLFGVVVGQDAADAAGEFNDNLDRLSAGLRGLSITLGGPLVSDLAKLSTEFLDAARAADGFFGGMAAFFTKQEDLNTTITETEKRLASLIKTRDELSTDTFANKLNDVIFGDVRDLSAQITVAQQELNSLKKRREIVNVRAAADLRPKGNGTDPASDVGSGSNKKTKADRDAEAAARFVEQLKKQAETLGLSKTELIAYDAAQLRLNETQRANVAGLIEQLQAQETLTKERESWLELEALQMRQSDEELRALEEVSAAEINRNDALQAQALAIKELFDPSLKLMNLQSEYDVLLEKGLITQEEYTFALEEAKNKQSELAKKGKEDFDELKRAVEGFGDDAAATFVDLAFTGEASFGDMVDSILKDLAKLAIKRSITDDLFGSADGLIGSLFSGFLPSYDVGTDYVPRDMVAKIHKGERILTAEENRRFGDVSSGGGGGVSVVVNVDANGGDVQSNEAFGKQLGNAIRQTVQQELLAAKRSGGMLTTA